MDRGIDQRKKAFVAGAFSQALEDDCFQQGLQSRLEALGRLLRERGFQVFSAHEREEWGRRLDLPARLAEIDLDELAKSDLLLAYVGGVQSVGTWIEIGVAISQAKRVIIVRDPAAPVVSSFFEGLSELGKLQIIVWTSDDVLAEGLSRLL
jgi:nucleoside 2-deoxyribosyltransferase